MDIETVHSVSTVVLFLVFVAIVLWAFGAKRKHRFEEAARLPFAEDLEQGGSGNGQRG